MNPPCAPGLLLSLAAGSDVGGAALLEGLAAAGCTGTSNPTRFNGPADPSSAASAAPCCTHNKQGKTLNVMKVI
jgi:hypothetical protein